MHLDGIRDGRLEPLTKILETAARVVATVLKSIYLGPRGGMWNKEYLCFETKPNNF